MKKQIVQLKAFSLEEWRFLLTAMLLLPLVALSLRMKGYKRTQNAMRRFMSEERNDTEPGADKLDQARVIARIVSVAAGHGVYRANCLKQSLVLWWMLARRGIKSDIVFGVQKDQVNEFNAHAWVECSGVNLSDTDEIQRQFTAFNNKGSEY